MFQKVFLTVALVGMILAVAGQASAQSIAVSSGVFNYDLSGTGNTASIAVSADWGIIGNWLVEGGLTYARPSQQFGERTNFFLPEAQVQHQFPIGRFAPFVGGGLGAAIDVRDELFGGTRKDLALSAGGGVRVTLTETVGARADFRLRGIGSDFSGSVAELRGGIYWRF